TVQRRAQGKSRRWPSAAERPADCTAHPRARRRRHRAAIPDRNGSYNITIRLSLREGKGQQTTGASAMKKAYGYSRVGTAEQAMGGSERHQKVFSYCRFSTPEQSMGDSERRQMEAAREWAKRKGLTLDESIKPDRGRSGRHGHHRTRGHFGEFLKTVEAGNVPRGSVLLVENIDRLGREAPADALQKIIFKLWDHGVTIQTISPEESYEPGCSKDIKFIVLILYLRQAWGE